MNDGVWLFAWMFAGWATGITLHEVAHWIPLRIVGGYDEEFSLIPPQVSFSTPAPVPLAVRVAAAAPWGMALIVTAVFLGMGWLYEPAPLAFWLFAVWRLVALSKNDRVLAFGNVETFEDMPEPDYAPIERQ